MKFVKAYLLSAIVVLVSCKKEKEVVDEPIKVTLEEQGSFGGLGTKNGQFYFSSGGDVNWGLGHDGQYLYVADINNHRVQRFDANNKFVDWWGALNGVWGYHTEEADADEVLTPRRFYFANGHIYLAGSKDSKPVVMKLGKTGEVVSTAPVNVSGFSGFCVDSNENIYVYYRGEITKYDFAGNELLSFGGIGTEDGLFTDDLNGIICDNDDNIVVRDGENERVQVFSTNGDFLYNWEAPGGYSYYSSLCFWNGYIYIMEDKKIRQYTTKGEEITYWKADDYFHSQRQILVANGKVYQQDFDNLIYVWKMVN